jgi:hypothetical protein
MPLYFSRLDSINSRASAEPNKNRLILLPLLVQFVHKTSPVDPPSSRGSLLATQLKNTRRELPDEGITQNCIGFSVF